MKYFLQPTAEQFEKAIATLRKGGIVAYPTETYYGLAVDPANERAIRSLYSLKQRDFAKPLSLIIPDRNTLSLYTPFIPDSYATIMDAFWPGPLTLVFQASPAVPQLLQGNGTSLAIRISSHPVAAELCRKFGTGITSTSANISKEKPCSTAEAVASKLHGRCDYILDGGTVAGAPASTIVEEIGGCIRIVREGVISTPRIKSLFQK